eukprot:11530005-Prorocentrum_lima.AAC.1
MTSSLVGSEMCIRDSVNTFDFNELAQVMPRIEEALAARNEAEGFHYEAVSYTHLTLPTICSV